jgi:hypothetical protein
LPGRPWLWNSSASWSVKVGRFWALRGLLLGLSLDPLSDLSLDFPAITTPQRRYLMTLAPPEPSGSRR